jgi:hypothetical protein
MVKKLKQHCLFTTVKVTTTVKKAIGLDQFTGMICRLKPTEIYDIQYSSKKPLYLLNLYTARNVTMIITSREDKEPKIYSWEELYNCFSNNITDLWF